MQGPKRESLSPYHSRAAANAGASYQRHQTGHRPNDVCLTAKDEFTPYRPTQRRLARHHRRGVIDACAMPVKLGPREGINPGTRQP